MIDLDEILGLEIEPAFRERRRRVWRAIGRELLQPGRIIAQALARAAPREPAVDQSGGEPLRELWQRLQVGPAPVIHLAAADESGRPAVNLPILIVLDWSARRRAFVGILLAATRAAFLSARNDLTANIAVIGAGAVTAFAWRTAWPDLIVGLAIFAINLDAAREVFAAAKEEHAEADRP
ncbi:MAG TPA: hypothetical protein VKX28_12615 [Xanthobacteraceae bacterium]|nr:hypothetical protein [Xanthobacteraceae bacterium]